jgi:hypothetical protein
MRSILSDTAPPRDSQAFFPVSLPPRFRLEGKPVTTGARRTYSRRKPKSETVLVRFPRASRRSGGMTGMTVPRGTSSAAPRPKPEPAESA